MLKQITLTGIILLSIVGLKLHGQGIEFSDEHWEEAVDRAAEEDKYLFIDCYTTWCGPCKKMDAQVFPLDSVGEFFNENFINLKLDMESKAGKKFAKTYAVMAYPTYIILNGDGEVIIRSCGYQPPGKFMSFGKRALEAEVSLTVMQQRYEGRDRDPEFLYNYFKVLKDGCFPFLGMVHQHLDDLMPIELNKAANWRMFNEFVFDMSTPSVKTFLAQPDVFVKIHGKQAVFDKAIALYQRDMSKRYDQADGKAAQNDLYNEYKRSLDIAHPFLQDALMAMNEAYYNMAREDDKALVSAAKVLVKKRDVELPAVLNDVGVYYLEHISDKKLLKEVAGWLKPLYEETTNPMYYLTYAAVLYKTGDTDLAEEVEAKMLTYGAEIGANTGFLKEKLEEYKQ